MHFTTYTHQDHSWTLQHCSSGSTSWIQTVNQDQRPGYKLLIRSYQDQHHGYKLLYQDQRPGYKLFIRITSRIQTVHQDHVPDTNCSSASVTLPPGSLSYIRIYSWISPTSGYIPGSLYYIHTSVTTLTITISTMAYLQVTSANYTAA